MHDLWIFGYGSLMWRPGFAHRQAVLATIHGYSRSFCVYSVHHRGSAERPGLVLGLDRGGACQGMAYRVAAGDAAATLGYLRMREQVTGVYREIVCPIVLLDGSHAHVDAVCYVAERAHPQYAGGLPLPMQAAIIRGAHGLSGANAEYLVNTVGHLRALGVRDRSLERLEVLLGASARLRYRNGNGAAANGARRPHPSPAGNIVVPPAQPRALNGRFGFRRRLAP